MQSTVRFGAHRDPIVKLLASGRGVYAASLALLPQLSLNSNLVGSITLKRRDRRRADPGCAGGFAEARAAAIPPSPPATAQSRRSEAETEARREGGRPRSWRPWLGR